MFETTVRDGVCRLRRPGTRWLSTGHDGGGSRGPAAYNLTVPEGFDRTDVAAYVAQRRDAAGFDAEGPALLTGVSQRHARRARLGPVEAVVTAGLSNPAALPLAPSGGPTDPDGGGPGTVNVLVGTRRALEGGALATLLATAVEARTATLVALTGFTGTTSDATVVGCDPSGEAAAFAGSATPVGAATRACVRDALLASLESRYPDGEYPASVGAADHGATTDARADVSEL